ncbi:MAG: bifunctional riboflavin kinase/FAD synthetase [Cyclobacteriaceae bacterium]
MRIIENLKDFPKDQYSVVTSGTFDGVHFGHQEILHRVVQTAKDHNGLSSVLTFWPHPRFVLSKDSTDLKLLTTFQEKAQLIEKAGIDFIVKIPFTKEFSKYSSSRFIEEILVEGLNLNKLVIGYDHRFGRNREGSFEYLKENSSQLGFEVEEIPEQDIDDIAVSSTKIREALLAGDIKTGNEYLGRSYSIKGTIIEGEKIGRKIGYPTANIHVDESYKLIPGDGIYAVRSTIEESAYDGMLYIGPRPTLNGQHRSIEVNLFDFDRDIYGKEIEIQFIEAIRKDAKFENLEQLSQQLNKDKEIALKLLSATSH